MSEICYAWLGIVWGGFGQLRWKGKSPLVLQTSAQTNLIDLSWPTLSFSCSLLNVTCDLYFSRYEKISSIRAILAWPLSSTFFLYLPIQFKYLPQNYFISLPPPCCQERKGYVSMMWTRKYLYLGISILAWTTKFLFQLFQLYQSTVHFLNKYYDLPFVFLIPSSSCTRPASNHTISFILSVAHKLSCRVLPFLGCSFSFLIILFYCTIFQDCTA